MAYDFERYGIENALDEERELARLVTHLDCTQQTFFQGAYSRHRRNPRTALALCLLLGGFGAHAFYLGRAGSGALRLLFCWTLIPALIALCEAPRIASVTQDYNIALARRLIGMIDGLRARAVPSEFASARARAASAASATVPLREHAAARADEHEASAGIAGVAAASVPLMAALTLPALESGRSAHSAAAPMQQPTPLFAANPNRDAYDGYETYAPDTTNAESDQQEQHDGDTADRAANSAAETDDALYGPAPVFAYSVASARRAPVRLEPLPAITAGELLAPDAPNYTPVSTTPLTPAMPVVGPRRRMQRITVRKVALIDGDIVAEASATREAQMDADPDVFAERVRIATEEARVEALRHLAAIAPEEVVQRARKEFADANLRTSTDTNAN